MSKKPSKPSQISRQFDKKQFAKEVDQGGMIFYYSDPSNKFGKKAVKAKLLVTIFPGVLHTRGREILQGSKHHEV